MLSLTKALMLPLTKALVAPLTKALMPPLTRVPVPHHAKIPAGAIRVARLLLALSSDVMVTDDEAMRAFSTGSPSFAIPHVSSATGPPEEMACSARGVSGQGRVSTPPSLLSKLGRMAGPSSPLLGLWRACSLAGPLSPRMRCRTSRKSHLAQGDPTSCRP